MPVSLSWDDIALRLALSVIAGVAIGMNRGERGRPAGLRTNLLVCLAAAVAMVQANLLMDTRGKASDSFVTLDLMRLPLGILTGVGFIGAGAILRRDSMVLGVTTAATLWFVTVVGLCFGGGQYALGAAATGLGLITLIGLKPIERRYLERRRAIARLILDEDGPDEADIRKRMSQAGYRIVSWAPAYLNSTHRQVVRFELEWTERSPNGLTPPSVRTLAEQPGVLALHWQPVTRH